MATSQVIDLAATRAAIGPSTREPITREPATREPITRELTPSTPRNRVIVTLAAIVDVFREARELQIRMLGEGAYRRLGES